MFSCCWVLRVLFVFWITVLHQMYLLQIFSPSLWLGEDTVFQKVKVLLFNAVWMTNSSFQELCLWCCIWKVIIKPKIIWIFSLSSRSLIVWDFTVRFMMRKFSVVTDFSPLYFFFFFAVLSKISWLYLQGLVSGLNILFQNWAICLIFHQYHTVFIIIVL